MTVAIKTAGLTGDALDWAVGFARTLLAVNGRVILARDLMGRAIKEGMASPSTDWAVGVPIIEQEGITYTRMNDLYFPKGNEKGDFYEPLYKAGRSYGPTPLVAAMRCYVASKLGDEVNVPDELAKR